MNKLNNEVMCLRVAQTEKDEPGETDDEDDPHDGTLILDVACAPDDIVYPTNSGLLADAIAKSDEIIDYLTKHTSVKRHKTQPTGIPENSLIR